MNRKTIQKGCSQGSVMGSITTVPPSFPGFTYANSYTNIFEINQNPVMVWIKTG